MKTQLLATALAIAVVSGCASTAMTPQPAPKDGELALPANYKSWPKFLPTIDKDAAKQVREIYMNPVAAQATAASGFGHGSVFVMDIYAARTDAEGKLVRGADGRLVKGEQTRAFVMGKGPGWGQDVPEALRNGEWVYASYTAKGEKGPEPGAACRGCHLPEKGKDFVFRYDEHFAQK